MKVDWDWTDLVAALVAGIVCAMLISGCCAESDEPEPIAEPRELRGHEHMEYVNFDGHEYVMYNYLARGSTCAIGGIAHSPKCNCQVNK
jgi:hypothetical protein